MPKLLTDEDIAKVRDARSLYEITGNIGDFNTLLVPRSFLDAAKDVRERGWFCQSKKYPGTKCIAMNPQVSDDFTKVTPLYAITEPDAAKGGEG